MTTDSIVSGDHVYLGQPGRNKLHWIVVETMPQTQMAHLLSPFSGQRRFEPLDRLVLHTSGAQK